MRSASHELSAGRPCERRDPSPLASKVKKGLCSSAKTRVLAAAMSTIALTLGSLRSQGRLVEMSRETNKVRVRTACKIPYAIALRVGEGEQSGVDAFYGIRRGCSVSLPA